MRQARPRATVSIAAAGLRYGVRLYGRRGRSGTESARVAIREMAARKADSVKIWLDDAGKSLPTKLTPEVYTAVIDEAHKNGLRVAAHIYDLDDAKAIVRAGVESATSPWTPTSST